MCPVLPTYNSNRNITANPAAPFRDEATQPFKNQQKIIGTMQDITQKWSDANDVMQYTDAKAKYEVAATDIQVRAASDPDFNSLDKYRKELGDAKKNSLTGISNQLVSNKLGLELDHGNALTTIKIDSDFRKKQLEHNKFQVATNLDLLQQKKITASTPAEAMQYDQQINELLNAQLKSGVLSEQEAQKLSYNSTKKSLENLVYANPQKGIAEVQKDSYLTAKDKNQLIRDAQGIEKADRKFAEWQTKQTQTQGTIDLSEALHNNTLTPAVVRDMQQQGTIDSETAAIFDALAINKKYDIPESTALGQPEYFLRLLDDSHGDKVKVDKVLRDAARAYNDNKIGSNQYRYFIQNAKETFERQSKGIFTKSPEQNKFMSAIDGIKSFFKNLSGDKDEKGLNAAVGAFSDRYAPGEDPHQIKDNILNQYTVKSKPEIENYPANGKLMIDKNGNRALVFPDGHIEEAK